MRSNIRRQPDRYPDRPQRAIIGYPTCRSFRHHTNDFRCKNILVTGHETGYRKQSQGLHSMPRIK